MPLEFETNHEYDNNANWVAKVEVPGADALVVTFDERSVTELNYDFLAFYADEQCSERLKGTNEKYHGAENWPGKGGSDPLRLEGVTRFWFRWVTDGSTTYWGWKMTIYLIDEAEQHVFNLKKK